MYRVGFYVVMRRICWSAVRTLQGTITTTTAAAVNARVRDDELSFESRVGEFVREFERGGNVVRSRIPPLTAQYHRHHRSSGSWSFIILFYNRIFVVYVLNLISVSRIIHTRAHAFYTYINVRQCQIRWGEEAMYRSPFPQIFCCAFIGKDSLNCSPHKHTL